MTNRRHMQQRAFLAWSGCLVETPAQCVEGAMIQAKRLNGAAVEAGPVSGKEARRGHTSLAMQSRRSPSCVCGAERFCEAGGKMVAWLGKGPHFTVMRAACYRARSEHALRAGMTSAENDALGRHLSEPPSDFECSCVHLRRRRRRARLVTCAQILCSQWSCWPFRKICGV